MAFILDRMFTVEPNSAIALTRYGPVLPCLTSRPAQMRTSVDATITARSCALEDRTNEDESDEEEDEDDNDDDDAAAPNANALAAPRPTTPTPFLCATKSSNNVCSHTLLYSLSLSLALNENQSLNRWLIGSSLPGSWNSA